MLKHFAQVRGSKPGPFYDGPAFGQLWLDYDPIVPASISDVEEYYNKRQLKESQHTRLASFPLVFSHLDIAPWNIMVLQDGSL